MNFNDEFAFNPFQPNQSFKRMDFTLGGETAQIFMSSLIEIFEQNGGENFLTMTFMDQIGNKYGVTIQNGNGELTPQEKISELEEENLQLRQLIHEKNHSLAELLQEKETYRKKAEYLKRSVANLTLIDEQLEEIEAQREMLQSLKDITLDEILGE